VVYRDYVQQLMASDLMELAGESVVLTRGTAAMLKSHSFVAWACFYGAANGTQESKRAFYRLWWFRNPL